MSLEQFLAAHPGIRYCEAMLFDLNGLPRGKWVPRAQLPGLLADGIRLPRSALALDIHGREVRVPGTGIDAGDPDAACPADPATLVAVPWLEGAAQVILGMPPAIGSRPVDPRELLKEAIARLAGVGLHAVVATELEFYLLRPGIPPQPAHLPMSQRAQTANQHQNVEMLEEFSGLLHEIAAACEAQGIPADTMITEFGLGQFEINLRHEADALAAADHAVMFRRLVRGVARRHGMVASFMAKPFGDQAGSGMHVHASLLDAAGRNVFDDGGEGSAQLRAAIGGQLQTLAGTMLLMAPHLNSYRRMRRDSYAPMCANWGHDNRTTAIRVPFGAGPDRRFEHRVAGADANPYLVIATILAAIHHGIAHRLDPGPAAAPNAYLQPDAALPASWDQAIAAFEASEFVAQAFGEDFQRVFAACKRHEAATLAARVTDVEYDTYLGVL